MEDWGMEDEGSMANCARLGRPLVSEAHLHYYLHKFLSPPQLTFGLAGNVLTLLVLNSAQMRSKTTMLLSCMTLCDLGFLLCRVPTSAATFGVFYEQTFARHFYALTKVPLYMLGNFFSCASIWLAVAVTVERTVAIVFPLRSHNVWPWTKMAALLGSILAFSGILVGPDAFRFRYQPLLCLGNGSVWQAKDMVRLEEENWYVKTYFDASVHSRVVLTILLPFVLMAVMNCVLVYYLRKSRETMMQRDCTATNARQSHADERKITVMVLFIVGSFLLLNFPSALVHLATFAVDAHGEEWHRAAVTVSNHLVLTAKTINFVLYCMASKHFRRNIPVPSCRPFCQKRKSRRRRQSTGDFLELSNCSSRVSRSGLRRKDTRSSIIINDVLSVARPAPRPISARTPKTSMVTVSSGRSSAEHFRPASSPHQVSVI